MVNACPWSTSKGIRGPVGKQNEMGEAEPGSRWEAGWDKLKEQGKPDVVLVGALAQILAFTQQKTTAASGLGGGGRVLMVAGAGFEPATFRL